MCHPIITLGHWHHSWFQPSRKLRYFLLRFSVKVFCFGLSDFNKLICFLLLLLLHSSSTSEFSRSPAPTVRWVNCCPRWQEGGAAASPVFKCLNVFAPEHHPLVIWTSWQPADIQLKKKKPETEQISPSSREDEEQDVDWIIFCFSLSWLFIWEKEILWIIWTTWTQ